MKKDHYCRRVCFVHESGDKLYPFWNVDLDGQPAFQAHVEGNKRENAVWLYSEEQLLDAIRTQPYRFRLVCPETGRTGAYSVNGRSIVRVEFM